MSPPQSPEPTAVPSLLHDISSGVGTITLNRPDAGNALTPAQRDEIIQLLAAWETRPDVRAIVLTAVGRHFCTGADLREDSGVAPAEQGVGTVMHTLATGSQRLVTSVLDCRKPVVAAVNGTAAGIGMHLALAADLVVAAESASFIEVFVRRGILPDGAGAYLLPRLIGIQRAKELVLLGDKVTATDAHRLGIVNQVVPDDDLGSAVEALAQRLAIGPTVAMGLAKRLLNRSLDSSRADALFEEAIAQELISGTADAAEGISSFVDRRASRFEGR